MALNIIKTGCQKFNKLLKLLRISSEIVKIPVNVAGYSDEHRKLIHNITNEVKLKQGKDIHNQQMN